ncbi:tomoregulin-2-like [Osmerus mordax]|uniref:tomoregulin-2-like n=1 Tax=Osmerus mordax TaxID=8014 RepID=UPI00350FF48A
MIQRAGAHERNSPSMWMGTPVVFVWLTALTVTLLPAMRPLDAFPTSSLSDCQTPSGWNCSGFEEGESDIFECAPGSCQFEGECVKIGETVTCICDFKCGEDVSPVCGSDSQTYQNDCLLRRASCKLQTEIQAASLGHCPADSGSGSGDDDREVEASPPEALAEGGVAQADPSSCEICQFGAECDIDDEDVWCVCNMDCSYISFNPVCASDGRSYDNPCQVKEVSCQRQKRIEVKHLGRCHDERVRGDGGSYRGGGHISCQETHKHYCVHGECEYHGNLAVPSCSCHPGFSGLQCDQRDRSMVFVVPGSGRVRYILIASVIGALQITIITLVVLCFTRKCPPKDRKSANTQNVAAYSTDSTLRTAARLI